MLEKKSSNECKGLEMTTAMEMQEHIRKIGWPSYPDEQVVFRIERAARKLGVSIRRARSYWYGEPATIPADHMDKARRLSRVPVEEKARNEFAELQTRIARLEAALSVQDPEFHGPEIDALRNIRRGADRAVD
ncbi:hypothetical protein [Stappia sp.]|uniref:hypothetical protein n=1 Tax=Stappia sp. TaxID=1870903 RepID=UPI003C7CBB76